MFSFLKKGKMRIEIPKVIYSPGEIIEGQVILNLKQQVEAKELILKLVAQKKERRINSGGGTTNSTTKVYDFKLDLDQEKVYPKGESVYKFQIQVPEGINANGSLPSNLPGNFGQLAQMASTVLTKNSATIVWRLKGNLKAKGMFNDVGKSIQISVNTNLNQ